MFLYFYKNKDNIGEEIQMWPCTLWCLQPSFIPHPHTLPNTYIPAHDTKEEVRLWVDAGHEPVRDVAPSTRVHLIGLEGRESLACEGEWHSLSINGH